VTDVEKHKFEHDFAGTMCGKRLKNSVNKDEDKERFSKSCMCVATYMMKDLTAQEAEKFLKEHENPGRYKSSTTVLFFIARSRKPWIRL